MRRKEREITDYNTMLEIVRKCDCLRLGFVDGDDAYIVPLNYGYEDKDGELVIYCHGAKDGRKADLIKKTAEPHLKWIQNTSLLPDILPAITVICIRV